MSFGVVWRVALILNKKDLNLWATDAKTGSTLVASACCMLTKRICTHRKRKEVRSSAQICNYSWNESRDWLYDRRFWNIKGC